MTSTPPPWLGLILIRYFVSFLGIAFCDHDKVDDSDDRVGMYWTTWIAHLKNLKVAYEERVDTKQDKGLIANFITGVKIVTFPMWKPFVSSTLSVKGHAKDMESFYKYQKEGYDAFRESMLHARPALMEAFPLKKGGNMVWVDIGAGTARYFTVLIQLLLITL